MIRRWASRAGAQMWLADNPETEGEPYLLRAILDHKQPQALVGADGTGADT